MAVIGTLVVSYHRGGSQRIEDVPQDQYNQLNLSLTRSSTQAVQITTRKAQYTLVKDGIQSVSFTPMGDDGASEPAS